MEQKMIHASSVLNVIRNQGLYDYEWIFSFYPNRSTLSEASTLHSKCFLNHETVEFFSGTFTPLRMDLLNSLLVTSSKKFWNLGFGALSASKGRSVNHLGEEIINNHIEPICNCFICSLYFIHDFSSLVRGARLAAHWRMHHR